MATATIMAKEQLARMMTSWLLSWRGSKEKARAKVPSEKVDNNKADNRRHLAKGKVKTGRKEAE